MVADDALLVTKTDRICTVTFNQPQAMNPITFDFVSLLDETLKEIGDDNHVRVVVLTGAGNNFSSGGSMKQLNEKFEPDVFLRNMKQVTNLVLTMKGLPQPIISKVRGVAYGIGVNIALNGDFVLASHDARFCQIFVNLGAILDGGGTFLLPRLVGLVKARELAMLGDVVSGQEAESIGLIYKSTTDEDLDAAVEILGRQLAKKPRQAMSMIKEGLEKSFDRTLPEALDWEAVHQTIALQSPEHKRQVQAFLAKGDENRT